MQENARAGYCFTEEVYGARVSKFGSLFIDSFLISTPHPILQFRKRVDVPNTQRPRG